MINYCIRKRKKLANQNQIRTTLIKRQKLLCSLHFFSNIIETHIGTHSWIEALGEADVLKREKSNF